MRITDHGYDRLKQRTGLKKKTAVRMAEQALVEGSDGMDTTGDFAWYLSTKRSETRKLRIYKRHLFFFSLDDVLITMFMIPKQYWKNVDRYEEARAERLKMEKETKAVEQGQMMDPRPPKRAFELNLNIGADTWEEVVAQLQSVTMHIEDHGPECNSISGGPTSGHRVDVSINPEMTHERYMEEVRAYLAKVRKKSA